MRTVIKVDRDSKYFGDEDTEDSSIPMNGRADCFLCGGETDDDKRISFIAEHGDGIIASKRNEMMLLDFHVDCFFIKFLDKGFNRFLNIDYIKKMKMKKVAEMV